MELISLIDFTTKDKTNINDQWVVDKQNYNITFNSKENKFESFITCCSFYFLSKF